MSFLREGVRSRNPTKSKATGIRKGLQGTVYSLDVRKKYKLTYNGKEIEFAKSEQNRTGEKMQNLWGIGQLFTRRYLERRKRMCLGIISDTEETSQRNAENLFISFVTVVPPLSVS